MYLQRYSHIQCIHPYLNRHVLMELYIPRQCTNPPETQLAHCAGLKSVTVVAILLQSTS